MNAKALILLAALTGLSGCASLAPRGASALEADAEAQAATLHHLLRVTTSTDTHSRELLCVGAGFAEEVGFRPRPNRALLHRFRPEGVRVRPASECRWDPNAGVRHRRTAQEGALLVVGPVESQGGGIAMVSARYYEDRYREEILHCTLRREADAWQITSCSSTR